ncbi:MAG: hypothetical protein V4591_06840 [Bdellovibrionota bacterium]
MLFSEQQRNLLKPLTALLILTSIFATSCQKESGKSSDSLLQKTDSQSQTKSLNIQTEITQAVLLKPTSSNDPTSQATALLDSSFSQKLPAKLICITSSLAYLGFVVDDADLSGFIQENTININTPEADLISKCNSKLNRSNQENIQISKLGIRFQGKDFELTNTSNNLKPIKIGLSFFRSLVNSENIFNLTCSKNNESYNLTGKLYFNSKTTGSNNILFINLPWDSFVSTANSFHDCRNDLSAQEYKKIYFMGDTVSEEDKFLIQSIPLSSQNQDKAFLICYFVDEEGKLKWHWGFDSFSPITKSFVAGKWIDGIFKTSELKSNLQSKCNSFSQKYTDGSWKFFDMQVANNVWSWGSQIIYNSDSTQSPYDKIVVFGDDIEENGSSKKYSGIITERIVSNPKPTFSENLASLLKIPVFNWTNTKESGQEQQSSASPLTTAVKKYLADSGIWGGELTQNTLFLIHVGGNYFTNSQNPANSPNSQDGPDLYSFSNDLSNAIANLAKENAVHIAIPDVVNHMQQLEINPQQLQEVFHNVIKNSTAEYPNLKITKIPVQDAEQDVTNNE